MMTQGISRFISTINALTAGLIIDDVFAPIYWQDLATGQHRNPTDAQGYFTTAFFHHPDELEAEVMEAGFKILGLLAVEGPAELLKGYENNWRRPEVKETILRIVRKVEAEKSLMGVSSHIMAVGRKQ